MLLELAHPVPFIDSPEMSEEEGELFQKDLFIVRVLSGCSVPDIWGSTGGPEFLC